MTLKTEKLDMLVVDNVVKAITDGKMKVIQHKESNSINAVSVAQWKYWHRSFTNSKKTRLNESLLSYNKCSCKDIYLPLKKSQDCDNKELIEEFYDVYCPKYTLVCDVDSDMKTTYTNPLRAVYIEKFNTVVGINLNDGHSTMSKKSRLEMPIPNSIETNLEVQSNQFVARMIMYTLIETDLEFIYTDVDYIPFDKEMVSFLNQFVADTGAQIHITKSNSISVNVLDCNIVSVKMYLDLFTNPNNRSGELEQLLKDANFSN